MVSGDRIRRDIAIPAFGAFFVALVLESRTLLPDVAFWDTAEFQAIGPVLGIAHPTGYPSYTLLAWLASVVLQPFGNEALRANLLSALLVSSTCALTATVIVQLTRRRLIALAAGVALALTPTVWRIGLRADAHALHILLVALLLVLLVAWADRHRGGEAGAGRWLVASAIVFGVALGNHALTLLLAPGIAVFVLLVDPWIVVRRLRLVLACAAALVLTTVAIYAYLPIRSAMDPPLDYANPETWEAFRYIVLGEQFRGTFSPLPSLSEGAGIVWDQLWTNLGPVAVASLAGLAVGAVRWPRVTALGGLWFVLTFVFALGYLNADIERYYLVPLLLAVIWAALAAAAAVEGLGWLLRRIARRNRPEGGAEPARRFTSAAAVVAAVLLVTPSALALPDTFAEVDASRETEARTWLDATFVALEPDAVIVSWWSFSTPMWYGRFVEGRRPDITIIDDRTILDEDLGDVFAVIERYLGQRPVYILRLSHDLEPVAERYELELVDGIPGIGQVWRVLPDAVVGS